jgi:hypothetical protein
MIRIIARQLRAARPNGPRTRWREPSARSARVTPQACLRHDAPEATPT